MSSVLLRSAARALAATSTAAASRVAARVSLAIPTVSSMPRALYHEHGSPKTVKFGDAESNPFPSAFLSDSSASETAAAGDGSEFFTEADLKALGLGSVAPTETETAVAEIAASLRHFPTPSFPASVAIEIHPILTKKLLAVAPQAATVKHLHALMPAAGACRNAAAARALLARAAELNLEPATTFYVTALDIAVYRSDRALLDAALKQYDAVHVTGKTSGADKAAKKRHPNVESAIVAFHQRTGDADTAFAVYKAAVESGVLQKPWRSVYANSMPSLTARIAVSSHDTTPGQANAVSRADRVRADAIVLHEPHPEANFAAWRYAMRALRGDMDLSPPGGDIRVPENLVIDIATQGLRDETQEQPGGRAVMRRRREMVVGYMAMTGKQMPVSIHKKTSLYYVPKAEVEKVVLSERHFLPSERKRLAEMHAAKAAAAAAGTA